MGKILMTNQPSGFGQCLAELAEMTEADFEDQAKMDELNERYDTKNWNCPFGTRSLASATDLFVG
ncbi:MAG: hypothetical protein KTR21_02010 [Rhodobacteraceae bacterium]|nr:hypothetical protein [Paracoccaceae bacterium]